MFLFFTKLQRWFLMCFLLHVMSRGNALGVSPTFLTISPQQSVANLTLSNEKTEPVTIQLEMVRWQQINGKDVYTETEALIATPQIFTLAPNGTQIVRLGLENPLFGEQEQAYRLFIQEVVPKLNIKSKSELRMALRISLPVIIKAEIPVRQKLRWQVLTRQGSKLRLMAENRGSNVLFINLLQAYTQEQQPVTRPEVTFVYLLPGSKKEWALSALTNNKVSSIKAFVNDQTSVINVD
ncbi:MAG: fimbria/pilus periplasmic chaperone [Legionella sp.]|uniref:fimbrial biogenesis chaperone n=1 Tax=Legionella sp. TaxID=459 RepID=UPI00283C3B7E|nr:fimbria/pilus periplasmic chaperone [Legionella sp.]